MDGVDRLQAIDRPMLTNLVRRSRQSETLEVIDWQSTALDGGGGHATGGVYRVAGNGRDRGEVVPWSLVLKVTRSSGVDDNPQSWGHGKRELRAYSSGLLEGLPGDLAAPRCYGAIEQPDGTDWLWLEEIKDTAGPRWPLAQYAIAARHLGGFNGAYTCALPTDPWLSSGWLRSWVAAAAPGIVQLPGVLDHPLVRRLFPADSAAHVLDLWARREALLHVFDRLPQTLCHFDAVRRNLFARPGGDGRDQTVVADWAFVGPGAIGVDLAPLVVGSVLLYGAELSDLPALEEAALAGYLHGLCEAGWRGDPRAVRLGYLAAAALRYTLYGVVRLGVLLDERQHAWAERAIGHPLVEFIDRVVAVREYALARMGEIGELMDVLA
jgi:hypothetical protein